MRKIFQAPLAMICLLALSSAVQAHPFHVTIAEAELNEKSGHLEVALKVNPVDLESLLRKRAKTRVSLDDKSADRHVVEYLVEVFKLRTRDGRQRKLKWVGKELEVKHAWLYFEFDVDGDIEGATIENRVFVNLLPKQQNTVVLTAAKHKTTLRFTRDQAKRTVSLVKPAATPKEPADANR